MHFPLSSNQNYKGYFSNASNEKTFSLLRFCIILGDKKYSSIYTFSIKFTNVVLILLGKAELSMASCVMIFCHTQVGSLKKNLTPSCGLRTPCHRLCILVRCQLSTRCPLKTISITSLDAPWKVCKKV